MRRETQQVVRQQLTLTPSARRRVIESVALRFPKPTAVVLRALGRLPPGSWLRRRLIRDGVRCAFEAINRGDIEASLITLSATCESHPPPEFVPLGFAPVQRGREERVRFQRAWNAELSEWHQEVEELIDCGDRVVVLVRMTGYGHSSAVPFERPGAYVLTIEDGAIVREHVFLDHDEPLRAAGLARH